MTTIKLILYIITVFALTTIIVQSLVFKPIRNFFKRKVKIIHKLLSCMLCTGFWVGVFMFIISDFTPAKLLNPDANYFILMFYNGLVTSGFVWLLYLIELNLEKDIEDKL